MCGVPMPYEWMCVQNMKYANLNIPYSSVLWPSKNLSDSLFAVQIEIYEKNNILIRYIVNVRAFKSKTNVSKIMPYNSLSK